MSKIIDEIYANFGQNMARNTQGNWESALLDMTYSDGDTGFKGGYIDSDTKNLISFKFRNFDDDIYSDLEELHNITTEGNNNKWNRAKFTLTPDGNFSIDFKWDQALADEIEQLNKD